MKKILTDKTILVTGGTSRLGFSFAEKAVGEGARVFFTFHQNKEKADTLVRQGAQGFQLDLSDAGAIEKFCSRFQDEAGELDILIHNAAAVRDRTIQNMSEDDWDYVMQVNLKAPFYMSKLLMPLLWRKKGSKIFMITSRMAYAGGFGIANYAAAKGGMIGLVKSMAQELGKKEVLVNAVNPGYMISGMTEHLSEKEHERNREQSPLKRFSDSEEVADFLVYLCSDKMQQVTGQVFHFESRRMIW